MKRTCLKTMTRISESVSSERQLSIKKVDYFRIFIGATLLPVFFILFGFHLQAQTSNLVFFTEDGERFTLYVNGAQQNNSPDTQVKVWDFLGEFAQIRVVFHDLGVSEMKKGIMVTPGMESSWSIRKNKKGEYTLRSAGEVPKPVETAPVQVVQVQAPVQNQNIPASSTTITTTTHQTTMSGQATPQGAGIGISINDQGTQVNMNINVDGLNLSSNKTGAVTTTTTQTTTTYQESHSGVYSEGSYQDNTVQRVSAHPAGCEFEMENSAYQSALRSIEAKSFSDEKFIVIKQILRGNCVSVNQVLGFMQLFTFEDDKIEVAKAAYHKTLDQSNYFQVNDQFTYSTSAEELNRFIESQY